MKKTKKALATTILVVCLGVIAGCQSEQTGSSNQEAVNETLDTAALELVKDSISNLEKEQSFIILVESEVATMTAEVILPSYAHVKSTDNKGERAWLYRDETMFVRINNQWYQPILSRSDPSKELTLFDPEKISQAISRNPQRFETSNDQQICSGKNCKIVNYNTNEGSIAFLIDATTKQLRQIVTTHHSGLTVEADIDYTDLDPVEPESAQAYNIPDDPTEEELGLMFAIYEAPGQMNSIDN